MIAVLAHDAVRLPNGVVLAEPQSVWPFADVVEATSARIGRCSVEFDSPTGSRTVRVSRWWRPRTPRSAAADPAVLARTAAELRTALRGARGGLDDGALALLRSALDDASAAGRAAERLVGFGPGLTPSGDDALCGLLLAARHLGNTVRRTPLALAVASRAPGATTSLSAALLDHAARGDACPQAVGLLDALAGHAPVAPALDALRAVGHTSGTDLALGVLAGAETCLRHHSEQQTKERP
ncbi:DUF2877 domain-containing protein [Actinorugispora endophytica]|uniref:Uncharacterized protein DUF2877 n=1 Tax=Actinorugispora endophytica TaxID=1605990 RepID=A0A4R6VAY6_9ACTN|nr:DUF2877 domain-containing protein [Actinorugispora endophytica]TDQ53817.1 uncharacterized protein DUF2877 [Actinorugispora endophytica]